MKTKLIDILSSFIHTDITDMTTGIITSILGFAVIAGGVLLQMHFEQKKERKTARAK